MPRSIGCLVSLAVLAMLPAAQASAAASSDAPPPSMVFYAIPSIVTAGQSTSLEWVSLWASACRASGGWEGEKPATGHQAVTPSATTTYTLTCAGAGGSAAKSTTITVRPQSAPALPPPATPPSRGASPARPPTLVFMAMPQTVDAGESSTLMWVGLNVESCVASGGWQGPRPSHGREPVTPSVSTTYTMACASSGETVTRSATVTLAGTLPAAPPQSPLLPPVSLPAPPEPPTTPPPRLPELSAPGFAQVPFVDGLNSPTAMEFAPDGRLFVCEQAGAVRVVKNGRLLPAPFVTLPVVPTSERGVLGIAFDPQFAANRFVYVYYTFKDSGQNRISRFTASAATPDVVTVGSEWVMLDNIAAASGYHNGGAIHFGLDGKLYVGVGDGHSSSNAQSLNNLGGKLLRLNPDGSAPADNPFVTTSDARKEIWALGLRNPFTFAVQPGTGRIHINDVGENTWEEINFGERGANYGWPTCEGSCSNAAFQNPVYAYNHQSGGCAITGGAFYEASQFPAEYRGSYFFADYCQPWVKRLKPDGVVEDFATDLTSPVDLKVSPDGGLYVLSHEGSVTVIRATSQPPSPPPSPPTPPSPPSPTPPLDSVITAAEPPRKAVIAERVNQINGEAAQEGPTSVASGAERVARVASPLPPTAPTTRPVAPPATPSARSSTPRRSSLPPTSVAFESHAPAANRPALSESVKSKLAEVSTKSSASSSVASMKAAAAAPTVGQSRQIPVTEPAHTQPTISIAPSVAQHETAALPSTDAPRAAGEDAQVVEESSSGNHPPKANAGADQIVVLPARALLNGSVSDDGRPDPPAMLSVTWSMVSGPQPIKFGNAQQPMTNATFKAAGSYVLRLTVTDGDASTSDELTVTVQEHASPKSEAMGP